MGVEANVSSGFGSSGVRGGRASRFRTRGLNKHSVRLPSRRARLHASVWTRMAAPTRWPAAEALSEPRAYIGTVVSTRHRGRFCFFT